jgi:predicted porin
VGYFLPTNLGGIYGQAMYAIAEGVSTSPTRDDGRLIGFRIGYAKGPFDAAFGWSKTKLTPVGDFTQTNLGASYDFGIAKAFFLWGENKVGATKARPINIGAHVPVGAGVIRIAYGRLKATGFGNDATHASIGYVHNLSKRTALYATAARLDNKGTGTTFNNGLGVTTPGGASTGYEMGVRHTF